MRDILQHYFCALAFCNLHESYNSWAKRLLSHRFIFHSVEWSYFGNMIYFHAIINGKGNADFHKYTHTFTIPTICMSSFSKRNTLKHTGMQMIVKCQLQIIAPFFCFWRIISLSLSLCVCWFYDESLKSYFIISKFTGTNLKELAADALVRREFFRLIRLNDIRFKNWRKSKLRTVSMVDCLKMEENIRKNRKKNSINAISQNKPSELLLANWRFVCSPFTIEIPNVNYYSIFCFFLLKNWCCLHIQIRTNRRGKIALSYRWLPPKIGCCIVDGDEMLRVTGAFVARTFNECARSGEQRVDFLSDIVVDDIRANSDWYGCRREGRRRISISLILHSSIGNGMS